MDVPLWAFLTTTFVSPTIVALLAIWQNSISNGHTERENERNRALERTRAFGQLRAEQRNRLYQDIVAFAEAAEESEDQKYFLSEEEFQRQVVIPLAMRLQGLETRMVLHASPEVRKTVSNWFYSYINFQRAFRVRPDPDDYGPPEGREQRYVLFEKRSAMYETLRNHLDELEGH